MNTNEETNSANNKEASCLNVICVNVYSCAPCMPCMAQHMPKPKTPNIDKLNEIIHKIKEQELSNHGMNGIIRTKSNDLTDWTKKVFITNLVRVYYLRVEIAKFKVIAFLPNVTEAEETYEQRIHVVDHFKTIKKFYDASFYDAYVGINSSEMQAFYTAVQIYESVLSVSFVVLNKHPDIVTSINKYILEAIRMITHYKKLNFFTRFMYGSGVLSNFNKYLALLDDKIGQLGIPKITEYVSNRLEIFCKYNDIGIERMFESYSQLSVSIKQMVHEVSLTLRSVFGDSIPGFERKKQWGPLELTEKIKTKLAQFDQKSRLVERTIFSFEEFFKSVEEIQYYFETCFANRQINQLIDTQIANIQESMLEQVREIAKIVQNLETILSYGILLFKNEDVILNPLLDRVVECTQVLNKFTSLHPLYKILLGKNYLSNLRTILKKILDLLKNSNLLLNSPKEFLNELKQKYPNLIYMLCESYFNDTLKKNLEFLPDSIKKAIDSACRIALSKLGDKLTFHSEENIAFNYGLDTDSLFKYRQTKPKETVNTVKKKHLKIESENVKLSAEKEVVKRSSSDSTPKSSSDESLNRESSKLIQPTTSNTISFKQYINKAANLVPQPVAKEEDTLEDSLDQSKSFSIVSQEESQIDDEGDDNNNNKISNTIEIA